MLLLRFIAALLFSATGALAVEQVHLSFTGEDTSMGLDFVAKSETAAVHVRSAQNGDSVAQVESSGLFFESIGWLHSAIMQGLTPGEKYEYQIEEDGVGSDWFEFTAGAPSRADGGSIAAIFGDLGYNNDVSLPFMQTSAAENKFDFVVHIGDFAYDLFTNNSAVGNAFMNAIAPIASTKPYMTSPGNHEAADNFVQYIRRFQAATGFVAQNSNSPSNLFYSFDAGLIHYVVIDTEVYKYASKTSASPSPFVAQDQLDWLVADLQKANQNRENVPWVVMLGHKAWYMDGMYPDAGDDFTAFDAIACEYGVDLYLAGHVHVYQRFLPVRGPAQPDFLSKPQDVDYDSVSDDQRTYTNPKYMPTIVVASPGNEHQGARYFCAGLNLLNYVYLEKSQVLCNAAYGYGLLQAKNATHLHWQWVKTAAPDPYQPHSNVRVRNDDELTAHRRVEALRKKYLGKSVHWEQWLTELAAGVRPENESDTYPSIGDEMWIVQESHGPRDYCNV